MVRGLFKGTMFEVEFSMNFKDADNVTCLSNVRVFSHFLKRATEIDRILVTPWKIYFVELKSFNSYIKGNLSDKEWIGITGKTVTKIYNPVMQNYEHLRSFSNRSFQETGKFVKAENFVVVPDSCVVQTNSAHVLNLSNFINKVWTDSTLGTFSDPKEFLKIVERVRVK